MFSSSASSSPPLDNPLTKPPPSKGSPPAHSPPNPPKKSTLRPDSVGMAVALNSHRPGVRMNETGPRRKKKERRGGGQKQQATSTLTGGVSFEQNPSPSSPASGGHVVSFQEDPSPSSPTSLRISSFVPTPSLRMFRHASGRVRQATQQEEQPPDLHNDPRFADPMVWAIILLQACFIVITVLCSTDDEGPSDNDYKTKEDFERAKLLLREPELQAYIRLLTIPFLRTFSFVVLLSDTSEHFALRENASMAMLFLGHVIRARASTPSNHFGRLDTTVARVVFFLVDIVFCYLSSFVRKRINVELSQAEKEDFVYSHLPGIFVGIIVPQAYLASEIAGCWISQGWTSSNGYRDAPDICVNIFVSNDALMAAFSGAGFLYLISKPFVIKNYSLVHVVGFNFTSFRTYAQIIAMLVAMFFSLFLYSTSHEVTDVKRYFEHKRETSVLFVWKMTESLGTQLVCNAIKFMFFTLLVSATVPLPRSRSSNQQHAGEASNDSSRRYQGFKLSRYLRSKLMTRRVDTLAPFYRFLTIIVLLLSAANLALEVLKKQSIYQDSWETFRFYETFCNQTSNEIRARYEHGMDEIDCGSLTANYFNDTVPEYSRYLCNHMACDGNTTKFYSLAEDEKAILEVESFAPPSYFGKNISKLLFSNCCLNLLCLLFLALTLMSKPKTRRNIFADSTYLCFMLISHACLLCNMSFSINEHGRFKLDSHFFWVLFSFIDYMCAFIIAKRCRKYLGLHTPNQINVHYQRTIQLFASSLPPALFLYLEAKNCKTEGVEAPLNPACAELAEANFAVMVNIVLGAVFFSLFNFTFQELKLEDYLRVSEKIQSIDVILRFILMGILQVIAMIIFGFRPKDTNSDDTDSRFIGSWGGPMMVAIWVGLTIVYYFKLGHDHHVEKTHGEEDEDVTRSASFVIWDTVNERTKWIVKRIRVRTDLTELSPMMRYIFLFLGLTTAVPFLILRILQPSLNLKEAPSDYLARFTLWAMELRFAGDLLIPIMVLYLTVHLFSNLSSERFRWRDTIPFVLISLCYIADTASFFEQPAVFEAKTNASQKEGVDKAETWFRRHVFVCVAVVFLSILAVVQKRRCLRLSDDEKKKHLFQNVAFTALSTLPTLVYLVSEYFACATRNIFRRRDEMSDGSTLSEIVENYAEKNVCAGISYLVMPLTLLLVFSAVGKVMYPESSDDITLKKIVTLDLAPFRVGQLVIGFFMAFIAIIFFGVRGEVMIHPWIEQLCTAYFCLVLLFFVTEGLYSTFYLKRKKMSRASEIQDLEAAHNDNGSVTSTIHSARLSIEMRTQTGSRVSMWDGGTGGMHKALEKDRTKRNIVGREDSGPSVKDDGDFMMGAGALAEGSLAPGFL